MVWNFLHLTTWEKNVKFIEVYYTYGIDLGNDGHKHKLNTSGEEKVVKVCVAPEKEDQKDPVGAKSEKSTIGTYHGFSKQYLINHWIIH